MPVFVYQGKDRNNVVQKAEIEANDEAAARATLNRQRITVTKLKPKPKALSESLPFLQKGVSTKDVILFCRQLSTMIDASLPILNCLEILEDQQPNPTFKKILKEIKDAVEGGQTFAEALEKYPDEFDDLFVNMIAAGEAGGILDTILGRLSTYKEKAAALASQIKGAFIMPGVTIAIAMVVTGIILVFVIPVFEEMFEGLGGALPLPTQFVVNLSRFVKGNIHWILLGMGLFAYAFKRVLKTEKGRAIFDDTSLRLPVFGDLLRKANVAKFTRTMGTMLSSGVQILEALQIVAKTAGNMTIEKAIYTVRAGIAEGRSISDPLEETGVFPPMVCQMINVGESTGALETMMLKIADFYDEEVDQAVGNMTKLIEPFMICFLGVVVGGLVVAMYLPIFKMAGAMG